MIQNEGWADEEVFQGIKNEELKFLSGTNFLWEIYPESAC